MNGTTTVALGAVAAVSIAVIGFTVYRSGNARNLFSFMFQRKSNLDTDLDDILAIIPLDEVEHIIHSYASCDKQISETIKFVNDMKGYMSTEYTKLPHTEFFIKVLTENGLDVNYRQGQILRFWNNLPVYTKDSPRGSFGGFTLMMMSVMETIPKNELNELLRKKLETSKNFRRFLRLLSCSQFYEFCQAIERNRELQRLFYWAKECDIEVIFMLQLLTCVNKYLTVDIRQKPKLIRQN